MKLVRGKFFWRLRVSGCVTIFCFTATTKDERRVRYWNFLFKKRKRKMLSGEKTSADGWNWRSASVQQRQNGDAELDYYFFPEMPRQVTTKEALSLSLRGVTRRFRPSALPRNIKRLFCCQRNASSDPRSSKILLVCPPVHQVALRRVAKFHRKWTRQWTNWVSDPTVDQAAGPGPDLIISCDDRTGTSPNSPFVIFSERNGCCGTAVFFGPNYRIRRFWFEMKITQSMGD